MAATGPPPNYYAILEISESATTQQVRDAYKKAALKTHPDRVPADSPERATRTRKFQLVNDAYYTLSDPSRRQEYDVQRKLHGFSTGGRGAAASSSDEDDDSDFEDIPQPPGGGGGPGAASSAYSWAWNYFTSQGTGGSAANGGETRDQAEDRQFEDVFEEMLREEGMAAGGQNSNGRARPTNAFWSMVGGVSGGAMGFIVGNMPGMLAGAVAGNRLGAVRDAKGKSVYAVFQELPQSDRAALLTQLAAKVFSHTVGA